MIYQEIPKKAIAAILLSSSSGHPMPGGLLFIIASSVSDGYFSILYNLNKGNVGR